MTYCVAMRLNAGLVCLSDSRTNAGVDHISTFRKMTVFEQPGERLLVLMSCGQSRRSPRRFDRSSPSASRPQDAAYGTRKTLFDAVRVVGERCARCSARRPRVEGSGDRVQLQLPLGGQIRGERMRLFQVYAAGNFIEATPENTYFQIGEAKYGKPIIDRVITPATTLDEAAKCALISMDSTLRSNISVGLPLDLLLYEEGALQRHQVRADRPHNQYMGMIRNTWGARLKQVFDDIPDPTWRDAPATPGRPRLETDPR